MKIESKKFLAFNMLNQDKENLIELYSNETLAHGFSASEEKAIRASFMRRYLTPSDTNYLFTKTAMDIVSGIKIKDTEETRKLIIDNADKEATFLINEREHIKIISKEFDEAFGTPAVIAMYISVDEVGYLSYDSFNITAEAIHHPLYEQGKNVERINTFLKMMIFAKCTNSEIEVLGPTGGNSKRRTKLNGEKFVNNLDTSVTLVNSKHNKIVYRDEEFYVNPHGRFQRHGAKNSKVKYIVIDGYYKKGYSRKY